METQQKSLDELFEEASPEQREAIRMLLKEKAGYPVRRKRQSGSDNESDSKPKRMPHRTCDNCSLSSYRQDSNDPYLLNQGCPFYPIRKFVLDDEELGRIVCREWANRRFAKSEEEDESEDESCES